MLIRTFFAISMALLMAGCASLGKPLPPAPTIAEIVQMAKEGVPAADIIKRMQDAGAVYRLPASELARLRQEGVPAEVIDYMQQTYIADERWRAQLYARDMYFWHGWPYYGGYWAYRRAPYWYAPPFW